MWALRGAFVTPSFTTVATFSAVAWPKAFWPTQTAGASSQRPMQGAAITRTFGPSVALSRSSSPSAPAMRQESVSHTRTVSFGGAASPSFTTSKWW